MGIFFDGRTEKRLIENLRTLTDKAIIKYLTVVKIFPEREKIKNTYPSLSKYKALYPVLVIYRLMKAILTKRREIQREVRILLSL